MFQYILLYYNIRHINRRYFSHVRNCAAVIKYCHARNENHSGRSKKIRLCFCLMSRQPSILFLNCFSFLLKTEIHTQILDTKPLLSDIRGPKYLQNKIGFLIRWFWSKLELFNFELPKKLKMIKIKIVRISIQSDWVTWSPRSALAAIRACLGPVFEAWRKFCSFEATMRQLEYELICFRTAFWLVNISAP